MSIINHLPFFYQTNNNINNGGFPQTLPFQYYFDEELKMFRQKPTEELNTILNKVYNIGSLADGSISSESGSVYIIKVINYLFENFNFENNPEVLEVGFGSGVILKELKNKGVKRLTGIEPGNHKYIDGLENINLIHDYFPSKQITKKFDLIYTLLVLEHIEEPLSYIQNLINQLTENGKIIFAVPNCEPYLKEGDISIFIHEHFSYFTKESIINLISKTEFFIEDISIIEGAFVVTISKNKINIEFSKAETINSTILNNKINNHIGKLNRLFNNYKEEQIAVYAPIRAINSLYLTQKTKIRWVDDNKDLRNKYLPAFTSSIENYDDILKNPPKLLLIFSRTFGEKIKQKCMLEMKLKDTEILTLNDLDNFE